MVLNWSVEETPTIILLKIEKLNMVGAIHMSESLKLCTELKLLLVYPIAENFVTEQTEFLVCFLQVPAERSPLLDQVVPFFD